MKIIGINASRTRSGGGVVHLLRILENYSFELHEFQSIHIWGFSEVLNSIPNNPSFVIHQAYGKNRSIIFQLFWEKFILPKELKKHKCDLLINLDAGTVCRFKPNITMSRDMLSYENNILKKYFMNVGFIRLIILRFVQINSLKNATRAVFLTDYAKTKIENISRSSFNSVLIPHGVDLFDYSTYKSLSIFEDACYNIVYVSNFDLYKNQIEVIKAFKILSVKIENIKLHLIGAFSNLRYYNKCKTLIDGRDNVIIHGAVPHAQIQNMISNADVLLFASSCENMPNTLLEYMSVKKPIICSNRGPMPEVLGDWDYYFDPEDVCSLVLAFEKLFADRNRWEILSNISFTRVQLFNWKRSSNDLFNLASKILN
jgi:glycosyltransferase involved in cell wall biosynthesis